MANKTPPSSRAAEQPSGAPDCVAAMAALAHGALHGWRGLPDACTRSAVETVFSLVTKEPTESIPYSGPLTYAPTPGAPNGLTVHYGLGDVEYIIVVGPTFTQPLQEMLGEPESTIQSHLEGANEQWVYPGLGLAFHMNLREPGVHSLYVFGPTTLQHYTTGRLSRVRTLRHKKR